MSILYPVFKKLFLRSTQLLAEADYTKNNDTGTGLRENVGDHPLDYFVILPHDDDRKADVDAKTFGFRVFATQLHFYVPSLQKCIGEAIQS